MTGSALRRGLNQRLPLRFGFKRSCPYCNSRTIMRMNGDTVLKRMFCSMLGVRPYLCRDCDRLHYARPSKSPRRD